MKRVLNVSNPRIVQLLLCLFVLTLLGCSSLKDIKGLQSRESILQLSVSENDFVGFNQRIQKLGLVALDFRSSPSNVSGVENNEFWVTFRFDNETALLRNYVNLMSEGFARRISYPYR